MKRIICMLLVFTVLLGLCACAKTNIADVIQQAQTIVAEHKAADDVAYKFYSEYKEAEKTFCIYMLIDTEKVEAIVDEANSQFKDMLISVAMKNLDTKTELHSAELSALKSKIEPLFQDTEVKVVAMYIGTDETIKQY